MKNFFPGGVLHECLDTLVLLTLYKGLLVGHGSETILV